MFDSKLFKSRSLRTIEPALQTMFNEGQLASMAGLGTIVHFSSGEEIIAEGTDGTAAFFITAGTAAVSRAGAEIAVVSSGELIGEQALVTGQLRNATITALMPVTALKFDRQQFAWLRLESQKVRTLSDELIATRSA